MPGWGAEYGFEPRGFCTSARSHPASRKINNNHAGDFAKPIFSPLSLRARQFPRPLKISGSIRMPMDLSTATRVPQVCQRTMLISLVFLIDYLAFFARVREIKRVLCIFAFAPSSCYVAELGLRLLATAWAPVDALTGSEKSYGICFQFISKTHSFFILDQSPIRRL